MIVKLMAKLRNPPMRAEELLRVAQLVEDLFVLRGVVAGRLDQCSYDLPGIADGSQARYYAHPRVDMSTARRRTRIAAC